jgi:WD40 repeat protein
MSLKDLPPELLTEVISHLPNAKGVSSLSRVNNGVHNVVEKEGWKAFVKARFPSMLAEGHWKEAAQSLTSLSRAWDRKALQARFLNPQTVYSLPQSELKGTTWHKPRGQTMGFQPVLDSYELTPDDSSYQAFAEVLAFSAGAGIILRTRFSDKPHRKQLQGPFDTCFHFRHQDAREGVDDITALKLLTGPYRKRNLVSPSTQQMIYGSASGQLSLSCLDLECTGGDFNINFETDGRAVRSADVSPDQTLLMSVLGEKGSLALYQIPDGIPQSEVERLSPMSERIIIPDGVAIRTWSTRFLCRNKVAVGLGPCTKPVQVYEITPSGLTFDPIHKFGVDGTPWECDDRVQVSQLESATRPKSSSIYPIIPLLPPSAAGNGQGEVFLSGGFDGMIRLHDTRSPSAYESCYFDPTDDGAIYSLLTLGRERLLAGTSRHSMIKFFDLRVSGGRAYWYDDDARPRRLRDDKLGWNLYLSDRPSAGPVSRGGRPRRGWGNSYRTRESPVYSLCAPSPASQSVYAGIENEVVQMDILESDDVPYHASHKHKWLNLAMYEQSPGGSIPLRVQRPFSAAQDGRSPAGYDSRWIDSRDA